MSRLPPHERPTPQELAAGQGRNPWACRGCGCVNWEVKDSRQRGAEPRKRDRVCRNCGELLPTMEVPVPPGCTLKVVPEDEEEEVAA
jgi:transcriptional regulator NrdR family protein